ncbi:MAG: serine/threonine protein kinase, partial [Fimbriiglobus sp.]
LVAADGTVKLTDFGVAKVIVLPPLGLAPDGWGTAGFLAPEFFTGKPLTRRSDLYALGGVLYAALAGRPPFAGGTTAEFMHKHCYALPDPPNRVVPKLPGELDDLICSLLSKDPTRRPATAAAVLESLDHARAKLERRGVAVPWPAAEGLDGTGLEAALADNPPESAAHPATPRPLFARPWVVGPLFALTVVGMAVGFLRPGPDPEALFRAAEPLVASDDPADWDRAWDEYLTPLSDRFPDQYKAEVAAAKDRILDRKELRRAVAAGAKVKYASEAERWYHRGLAEARAGDAAAARRTWEAVGPAFGGVPSESRWVRLSADALEDLAKARSVSGSGAARPPLAEAIRAAAALAATDPPASAAAFAALESLYRDDPAALETIRQGR